MLSSLIGWDQQKISRCTYTAYVNQAFIYVTPFIYTQDMHKDIRNIIQRRHEKTNVEEDQSRM